jgi:hypothetical protein
MDAGEGLFAAPACALPGGFALERAGSPEKPWDAESIAIATDEPTRG